MSCTRLSRRPIPLAHTAPPSVNQPLSRRSAVVLTLLACVFEGWPQIAWSTKLVLLLAYGSVFGVALAYWAMAMVNRSLPAVTTSLGVLATPVVWVVRSMVVLGEPFSASLLIALVMIVGGIALGTVGGRMAAGSP